MPLWAPECTSMEPPHWSSYLRARKTNRRQFENRESSPRGNVSKSGVMDCMVIMPSRHMERALKGFLKWLHLMSYDHPQLCYIYDIEQPLGALLKRTTYASTMVCFINVYASLVKTVLSTDAPVDHHLVGLLPVLLVSVGAHLRVQLLQVDSSHIGAAPHGHCGSHGHSQSQISVLLLVQLT